MTTITLQEMLNDPLNYIRRVENGESIIVMRDQVAVAEIVPCSKSSSEPRPFGLAAGKFTVPVDFNAPLPEDILSEFENS